MQKPKTLRVLNLEDSPLDTELIQANLLEGGINCEMIRVQTRADFAATLEKDDFDLILSDYTLPSFDGLSALEMTRKMRPEVPFILVSGTLGEEEAVESIKSGATDYVLKHRLERLVPAVRRAILEAEERSQRRRTEEALRQSEELYRTVVEQAAENIFLVDVQTKRILEANTAFYDLLGYTLQEIHQLSLYELVAHDRQSIDLNVQRIMHEGRARLGERRYRRKDGKLLDVEVNVSTVTYKGKEVMCVTSHDITERKQAEESLRRSLDILLALREAGQILSSTLRSEEIGSRLLEIMRSVSGLTTAVISTQEDDDSGQFRIWRAVGLEALQLEDRYTPKAQEARRMALQEGEHRLFELSQSDAQKNNAQLVGLCLPLRAQDRVIGVLEAYGPQEELARDDIAGILGSLAAQAASALENARLYEELAEREKRLQDLIGKILMAQEEERRRVAYEVHDSLAQLAVSAHQHLQAFAWQYPPSSEQEQEDLERAVGIVQQTVRESRRIIANLRPTVLDDFGLAAAVSSEVKRLREEDYWVDYEEELGDERLPTTMEITLFRVAQEALTNVRKHAQTRRVSIVLRRLGDEVHLKVRDQGCGFDMTATSAGSGPGERVGLVGMQERIGLLGGKLEIHSRPGAGTLVIVTVPLSSTTLERNRSEY